MVKLFLVFTNISQKDVAKISEVPKALHNVNPARAITGLVSVTIILLYHFLITIHLYLASFYASQYFEKNQLGEIKLLSMNLNQGGLGSLAAQYFYNWLF